MYCTQCKIEAKATAKFCPKCGGQLVSQVVPTPENRPMQCPQCGKIYGTDHQFCADDGSHLQPQRTPTNFSPKPPPTTTSTPVLKIVLLVLVFLFLAALGTGGYLYFSGRWMDIPVLAKWFTPPSTEKSLGKGTSRSNTPTIAEENLLAEKFCGTWEYVENTSKSYFKITKVKSGRFKLNTGYKYEGKIAWQDPDIKNADGIYLKLINGKLKGEFVSSNFYATHGMEFTYKITLDLKSNNKLLYSVWSGIRGETNESEATKINDNQFEEQKRTEERKRAEVSPQPSENQIKSMVEEFYRLRSEWKGVFVIDGIERVRLEPQSDRSFIAHVRYKYRPVTGSYRRDTGYDQRTFLFEYTGSTWEVRRMGGNMSARF